MQYSTKHRLSLKRRVLRALTNEFQGHITGLAFCFFCEDLQIQFVHIVGMPTQKIVNLHFEGFCYKETGFYNKGVIAFYANFFRHNLFPSTNFLQLTFR